MPLSNRSIVKNSLPIAIAYLFLGATFGILFSSKGGSPLESFFISTFCFAGAAQFVALEFYKPEFSSSIFFLTIFTLNLRHIFYGLTFLSTWKGAKRTYLFLALTDENFGISSLYRDFNPTINQWIKIYGLNHLYWVTGCVIGSFIPKNYLSHVKGIDFILIALFVAIFSSMVKKRRA